MTTATLLNPAPPAVGPSLRALARHAITTERVLLGACFFVFGLNGFLNFITAPKDPGPAAAMAFGGALLKTGYFMPLLKGVETVCGALLLSKRFVPLALTLVAPVLVNIVAFHAFLAPAGIVLPMILVALELHLAWTYRSVFRPMLAAR
jgi:hypothetical protein